MPAPVQAQDFAYSTNNGTLTIVGYTGSGGAVTVPSTAFGLTVTGVGDFGFTYHSNVTSISLPSTINNIVGVGFWDCTNLSAIEVDPLNSTYSSVDGVLFNRSRTELLVYPPGKPGSYTIPNTATSIGDFAFLGPSAVTSVTIPDTVTNIGDQAFGSCASLASITIGNGVITIGGLAFNGCTSLTRVVIPDSVTTIRAGRAPVGGAFGFCSSLTNVMVGKNVTNLGDYAFVLCGNMQGVYFRGNPPSLGAQVLDFSAATVYYLPTAIGWGPTFAGHPTRLWNPQAQVDDGNFGLRQNGFGFNITGTADIPIVVEASTNPTAGLWVPLESSTLTNGSIYFSDRQWTNYPSRFYHIRSP